MREARTNNWVMGALIVAVIFGILFAPSYGWKVRAFLSPSASSATNDSDLAAENATLKAELAKLAVVASQLPSEPANYLRAMVYSRYPLNFKNEFLVNAGSNEGVTVGKAVMFQGMLIGQIESVFPDSALVMTVFDDRFKLPVRIGSSGFDGLLSGGSYPTVGSIVKSAALAPHDIVYSAAAGTPFGLPIGDVASTMTSADSLFEEAALNFNYDLNSVESVFVQK